MPWFDLIAMWEYHNLSTWLTRDMVRLGQARLSTTGGVMRTMNALGHVCKMGEREMMERK